MSNHLQAMYHDGTHLLSHHCRAPNEVISSATNALQRLSTVARLVSSPHMRKVPHSSPTRLSHNGPGNPNIFYGVTVTDIGDKVKDDH